MKKEPKPGAAGPGRPEERVVIEGDWRDAVAQAFKKTAMPKAKSKRKAKRK